LARKSFRTCAFFLLTLLLGGILFASDPKASLIISSGYGELQAMAETRGIDPSLPESELREALMDYEGISEDEVDLRGEGKYSLEIVGADSVQVLSGGEVELTGDVEVSFSLSGEENKGNEKHLYAEKIIVDSANSMLMATGDVKFIDKANNTGLDEISSDVVTYLWDSGSLIVGGGMTSSERTTSEGEKVMFYTSGDELHYTPLSDGLFFNDGYITSNPKHAYTSISAKNIALLEGGDMYLSSAWLKLGRVPVFYFPFFFFPGSRMVMNPSFGFSSPKGMFLETTTELFGSYPQSQSPEGSSFASLLKSDEEGSEVSNGIYYESGTYEEGSFGAWAEKTKSYGAIKADVYSKAGFLLGFDSSLNSSDGKFSISTNTNYVLSKESSSWRSRNRYYSINKGKADYSFVSFSLDWPVYSDPEVLRTYENRITTLSIEPLLGSAITFPDTYSSLISDYTAYASMTLKLPSKHSTKHLDSLSISDIRIGATYDWSSSDLEYNLEDITLPSGTFSASGDVFSFSSADRKPTKEITVESEEEEGKEASFSDFFLLDDPLLRPMYEERAKERGTAAKGVYSVGLSYKIRESISHTFDYDKKNEEKSNEVFTNSGNATLTFDAKASNYFTLTSTLTPQASYSYREANGDEEVNEFSLTNTNKVSIPIIGITYNLSETLYTWKTKESDSVAYVRTEDRFEFDEDHVKTHSLVFDKTLFSFMTLRLTEVLPPITETLEPSVSVKFGDLTAATSMLYKKTEGSDEFKEQNHKFSIGFSSTHFTASASETYDLTVDDEFPVPLTASASASIRSKDKRWSFTEYVSYSGKSEEFDAVRETYVMPSLTVVMNRITELGALKDDYLNVTLNVKALRLNAWFNRLQFALNASANLHYDFENKYSSTFTSSLSFTFAIKEFLDFSFSVSNKNNGIYRYEGWGDMFDDLKRSFDFVGDGRHNTQFNLNAIEFELVHYMEDWDLHCKYSSEVVSSKNRYAFQPTFTIYLKWKTMPDLKVDEKFTYKDGTYVRGSSST